MTSPVPMKLPPATWIPSLLASDVYRRVPLEVSVVPASTRAAGPPGPSRLTVEPAARKLIAPPLVEQTVAVLAALVIRATAPLALITPPLAA